MILQMIKKQALIFLRNPVEMLLLLGLPIILITILGNALGSMMDNGEVNLSFKVVIVEHEEESVQVDRFISELENTGLPDEAIEELHSTAQDAAPIATFLEVLQSEELKEMITLERITPGEIEEATTDESFATIIEFPENFTYQLLEKLMLEGNTQPEVEIHYNAGSEIAGNIMKQILSSFQEQYTLASYLGEHGIDPQQLEALTTDFKQEVSSVSQYNPVTSKAYYTIGMVVMNVLFMATTIANYAFQEKHTHIFDRMILADISRWSYFISNLLIGTIFAFIQSVFVFSFAYLVFDVTWPDIRAFFIITFFFALAVGGIGVLLTAISFRINSERITGLFSGIVVTLFAFLGGSFFPVGYGSLLQRLGDFTPNGAAMSAYLTIIRGGTISDSMHHLLFIVCFALGAILFGVLGFPKRGAVS